MWGISIPNSSTAKPAYGEQLPLAFDVPPATVARKVAAGRRAKRQPPLRVCGQCAGSFRSWREDGLCGRCEEDGTARPKSGASPSAVELGGDGDDGSLHYMMTGEPEPPRAA